MTRKNTSVNPSRDKDKPIMKMLGLSMLKWYQGISADDRRRYRYLWSITPEQDRLLSPEAWQLKYLGCMFIRPQPPTGPQITMTRGGDEIVHYPNGDVVIKLWQLYKDGSDGPKIEIIRRASGETEIVTDEGTEVWRHIRYTNGTTIQRRSNMGGRSVMQIEYPNSIIITQVEDGRVETQYPNGATILRNPDGSEVLRMNGDEIELAPPVKGWEDVQMNRRHTPVKEERA